MKSQFWNRELKMQARQPQQQPLGAVFHIILTTVSLRARHLDCPLLDIHSELDQPASESVVRPASKVLNLETSLSNPGTLACPSTTSEAANVSDTRQQD